MLSKKIALSAMLMVCGAGLAAQYRIEMRRAGVADSMAALFRYTASGREPLQSKRTSADGVAIFTDPKDNLPQGMYVATLGGEEFPFLVSNDEAFALTIIADAERRRYSGSKENEDFLKYLDYQEKFNAILHSAQQNYQRSSSEVKAEINTLLDTLRQEQAQFAAIVTSSHPKSLLASVVAASQTPALPHEDTDSDSLQWRREVDFAKRHYFDNVNFNDGRLINTPVLTAVYSAFFNEIIAYEPVPDIIEAANALLERAAGNNDMYHYTLAWLYRNYTNSQMEAHFAVGKAMTDIMADSSRVDWLTPAERQDVLNSVKHYALNPVGAIAADLSLQTASGAHSSLYMVSAPYTLLYFYNPECQTCRIITPLLYAQFLRYKDRGLQVYAVYTGRDKLLWERYMSENNFSDFINVWDASGAAVIGDKYSLHAVPQIYVLDGDKKILHKSVSIDELQNILFIVFLVRG